MLVKNRKYIHDYIINIPVFLFDSFDYSYDSYDYSYCQIAILAL